MSEITHHVPDSLLAAYVGGSLEYPFALAVAAHVSLCLDCRATMEAHQALGGAVLEAGPAVAPSETLKSRILDALDTPATNQGHKRSGIYPGPVMAALEGRPPRWKPLGGGIKQSILSTGRTGAARLLHIPPGRAVPEHSHNGMELTLVLQGSFSDATGRFDVGDIEVADADLDHQPIADEGDPCICLAATDAPLRFNALIPRLLQPLFRI